MDGSDHMAVDGRGADDVRAHRHVLGVRIGPGAAKEVPDVRRGRGRAGSSGREHHQHRSRFVGMADAAEMLSGINSHVLIIVFGVGISAATVWLRYGQIANVLKWLALFLFAYLLTAIVV